MARQKGPLNAGLPPTVGHMTSHPPGAETADAEDAQCVRSAGIPQRNSSTTTPDGLGRCQAHATGATVTRLTHG